MELGAEALALRGEGLVDRWSLKGTEMSATWCAAISEEPLWKKNLVPYSSLNMPVTCSRGQGVGQQGPTPTGLSREACWRTKQDWWGYLEILVRATQPPGGLGDLGRANSISSRSQE